jgi:O-antigen/teichoic acid export membrane protein
MRLSQSTSLKNNILKAAIFQAGHIFFQFLLVRIFVIDWGPSLYGESIAILSILAWTEQLDLGAGNGLKSELTNNFLSKNDLLIKITISHLYFLSLLALIIFIPLIKFLPTLLNQLSYFKNSKIIPPLPNKILILVLLNYFTANISTILISYQNFNLTKLMSLASSSISVFMALYFKNYQSKEAIISIVLISSIIVYSISTLVFFYSHPSIIPSKSHLSWIFIKNSILLNFKYFFIQINYILLFSSMTILIFNFYGGDESAEYQTLIKYFAIISTIANLIATPGWTAFTKAFYEKNNFWIKSTYKKFNLIILILCFAGIILFSLKSIIFKFWLMNKIIPGNQMTFVVMVYVLQSVVINFYSTILNSQNKIKSQIYLGILGAIILFPCAHYFSVILKMGSIGIVYAGIFAQMPFTIVLPIQSYLLVYKNEK